MALQITNEGFQDANHNMLIEILARTKVTQDMLLEMKAKETGMDISELEKEMERKVYNNMKQISDGIYAEFGSINPFEK